MARTEITNDLFPLRDPAKRWELGQLAIRSAALPAVANFVLRGASNQLHKPQIGEIDVGHRSTLRRRTAPSWISDF